ncbi:MAG: Rab family GTPase, partial [Candidatus Hodarchaeales archaeon]
MLLIKVILVGDKNCGKTELRQKYLGENSFKANYMQTIGADFAVKELFLLDTITKFQIWDISSQNRFDGVRSLYYAGTHGSILVFDVSRPETYKNCWNWVQEIKQFNPSPIPIVLVGNNINARENNDPTHIQTHQGYLLASRISEKYLKGLPVPYFETSPETGQNILAIFHTLAELVFKDQKGLLKDQTS